MTSIWDTGMTAGELPDEGTSEWDGASLTVPFSDIPPIPATSLWRGVIPNRTVTVVAAPGGTGKGLAFAAIEAMVTTGEPFPGETEKREPGQVIKIAPEDDANEDTAYRLIAAGANRELVRNLTLLPSGAPFRLPDNVPELYQSVAEINEEGGPPVRLVTIDPLLATCTARLMRSDPRAIIEPLQALAADTGIAVLASHHTTKNPRVIAGGQALTDAARLVWVINVAKDDENARTMSVYKTNRRAHPPLRFRIEGEDEEARAVFITNDSKVPGSRAAKLRLVTPESAAEEAKRWLAEHKETETEEAEAS